MTTLLVLLCLFVAPVLALCAFIKWNPGAFGEWLLHVMLVAKLDKSRFRILRNVMLPTENGATTQIDHIVVCAGGVFVIETKTYGNNDTRKRPGTHGRPRRKPPKEPSAKAGVADSARIRRTDSGRRRGGSRLSEMRRPDGPSHAQVRRRLVLGLLRLPEMPRNPRCSTDRLTPPRRIQHSAFSIQHSSVPLVPTVPQVPLISHAKSAKSAKKGNPK